MPRVHPTVQRVLVPIDGHTVAADVHLLDDGRPPVVFLHGMLTSLDLARELFVEPDRESWIALSLPGHAPGNLVSGALLDERLFADLTERALDSLIGDRRVIAVGWSTGAFNALATAIHHPHRVAAVVSLAGFADGRSIRGPLAWLMWLAGRRAGRRLVAGSLRLAASWPWLHRTITSLLTAPGHSLPHATTAAMHAAFRDHDPDALAAVLAALPALDVTDQLQTIRVPTWVVGAAADPAIPVAETRRLAELIPRAALTLHADVGHLFFSEWPTVRADLASWRAGLVAAGSSLPPQG